MKLLVAWRLFASASLILVSLLLSMAATTVHIKGSRAVQVHCTDVIAFGEDATAASNSNPANLAGAATAQGSLTGGLTGTPKLAGSSSATATAAGGLTGTPKLAGSPAATGACTGGLAAGAAGGAVTANIWVDTNGGTCTDSATPVAYSDAAACGSFDAANDTCEGGDTVGIKGGSYGNQTVTKAGANSARASTCTMTVADGENVTVGTLDMGTGDTTPVGPNYLTLQGDETTFAGCRDVAEGACSLTMGRLYTNLTDHVTVKNFEANGGAVVAQCFTTLGNSYTTYQNGRMHNCRAQNTTGAMMWLSGSNITLENIKLYDGLYANPANGAHTECAYASATTGLTIRGSVFYSCATEDIFFTTQDITPNLTVENSIFQIQHGGGGAFAFRYDNTGYYTPYPTNATIRNNIIYGVQAPFSTSSATGVWANNYFRSGAPCGWGSMTYQKNAGSTACANGVTVSNAAADAGWPGEMWTAGTDYTSSAFGDWTLSAGSPLIDAGNNANCPSIDFNGNSRPVNGTCDIGPYEYQG